MSWKIIIDSDYCPFHDTLDRRKCDSLRHPTGKCSEEDNCPYKSQPDDQDSDAIARYEKLAEAFYRDTGYMAPGKDVPAAMGNSPTANLGLRQKKWTEWLQKRKSQPDTQTEEDGE